MFKVLIVVLLAHLSCIQSSTIEPVNHVQSDTSGSLQRDLNEFLNILPVDDIRNLTEYYYANDAGMRESYEYLRTDGCRRLMQTLSKLTLVKKFTAFLNDTGVNFAELGKRIERIVLTDEEAKSIVVNETEEDASGDEESEGGLGGMNAYFKEALSLIPQDEVLTLFFVKMEQSNAFSSFLEKLNASDYENLTESLKKSHGVQSLYFELYSHGIDMMEWAKALKSFFGY